ncbi:hypothetical protein JL721_8499 [Aureococcus anophagefferens]|nr:hypothetical protein JL721_8499 [Aureococcus anophagefferens]
MCAAYDASQLASGKPAVRDYASPTCGWAVRCTKAPILSVAKRSLSSESHVAWKRELGLGAYGGMELPAALYGRSALELRHGASGVRLSLRLEALSVRRFGAEPATNAAAPASGTGPSRRPTAARRPWPTSATACRRSPTAPASTTAAAAAAPRARGARRRRKCVFGRKPLLGGDEAAAAAAPPAAPPPPPWRATAEAVDIEALLAAHPAPPPFEDSVELWCVFRLLWNLQTYCRRRDDLDPHSFAFFRVRVRFAGKFWVAFSRFFIRVNGVLARVLDTRFVGDESRVLRERTWREGDWETFAGPGAPPCGDFGGVASRPPASRATSARRFCGGRVAAATARAVTVADAATGAVVERVACDETVNALAGGRRFAAATRTGVRCCGGDHAEPGAVLAAAASGDAVAAGCIDRKVRVFFPGGRRREWTGFSSAVERLAWSASGTWLAAVGGRAVALRRDLPPGEAPVRCAVDAPLDVAFDPAREDRLVVGARGGVFVFDLGRADDAVPRLCFPVAAAPPARAVAFCGGRVVAVGDDGAVFGVDVD